MIDNHKCRYCSYAVLNDFDFPIKDMNKNCLIYCEAKDIIKQNINRINKCKHFSFNPLCVVTMEEFKPNSKNRNQDKMKFESISMFEEKVLQRHSTAIPTKTIDK